jgi:hypothetical protein
MIAISYIIVTILSIPMLHEKVPVGRWISLSVICLGVVLLATLGAGNEQQHHAVSNTQPGALSQHASATNTSTNPDTHP